MPSPTPRARKPTARRTTTFGTVAWLVVLGAVAGVQLSRRAWVDSAALLVVLAALLADAAGRLPRPAAATPSRTRWPVVAAAVLAGAVLVLAPRHTVPAGLAVAMAGGGALAYAWPDRKSDRGPGSAPDRRRGNGPDAEPDSTPDAAGDEPAWDRPTTRTATAWTAAWVVGCLWELAMFLLGGTRPDGRTVYPAASDLADPWLANPVVKAAFVVVWLAVGVGLLARVDRR